MDARFRMVRRSLLPRVAPRERGNNEDSDVTERCIWPDESWWMINVELIHWIARRIICYLRNPGIYYPRNRRIYSISISSRDINANNFLELFSNNCGSCVPLDLSYRDADVLINHRALPLKVLLKCHPDHRTRSRTIRKKLVRGVTFVQLRWAFELCDDENNPTDRD